MKTTRAKNIISELERFKSLHKTVKNRVKDIDNNKHLNAQGKREQTKECLDALKKAKGEIMQEINKSIDDARKEVKPLEIKRDYNQINYIIGVLKSTGNNLTHEEVKELVKPLYDNNDSISIKYAQDTLKSVIDDPFIVHELVPDYEGLDDMERLNNLSLNINNAMSSVMDVTGFNTVFNMARIDGLMEKLNNGDIIVGSSYEEN